jgi:hypothetical protein
VAEASDAQPPAKIYRSDGSVIDIQEFVNISSPTGQVTVKNDTLILGALLGGILMAQVEQANALWAIHKEMHDAGRLEGI